MTEILRLGLREHIYYYVSYIAQIDTTDRKNILVFWFVILGLLVFLLQIFEVIKKNSFF